MVERIRVMRMRNQADICQPQTKFDVALQYDADTCAGCRNEDKCYKVFLEWCLDSRKSKEDKFKYD